MRISAAAFPCDWTTSVFWTIHSEVEGYIRVFWNCMIYFKASRPTLSVLGSFNSSLFVPSFFLRHLHFAIVFL